MHMSSNEANLIVTHEGYRADWYQDIAGHWTIGCGYMNDNKQLPSGFPYSPPLSRDAAVALIYYIAGGYETIVNNAFPNKTFTQYQYDAMFDHAYGWGNIGADLKNAINNGLTGDALKNVFYEYCHAWSEEQQAYIEVPYLKKILYTQYNLYSTGSYAFVAEGDTNPPPSSTVTLVLYSSDKIVWHKNPKPGDNWKRFSSDGGATFKIVAYKYPRRNAFFTMLLNKERK